MCNSRTGTLSVILLLLLIVGARVTPALGEGITARDAALLFPGYGDLLRTGPASPAPAAVEVFANGALVGYAFSSRAVTQSVGYSGRPIDVHVGLGLDGRIKGARLVRQEEPILVIGIRPQDLDAFVRGLAGLDIRLSPRDQKRATDGPDHVAGATVSSTVITDAVLRSARTVAAARGLLRSQATGPEINRSSFTPRTWDELVSDGAIASRQIKSGAVADALGTTTETPDNRFIELYAALIAPPTIGQNLLGVREYERVLAALPANGHAILIAARGLYSFKGAAWRQSGTFDRIQLVQGSRTLRFTADMHENVERLVVRGAPDLREIGLFRIPPSFEFDAAAPWRIELAVAEEILGVPRTAMFPLEFQLPRHLLRAPVSPAVSGDHREPTAAGDAGPVLEPLWVGIWQDKRPLMVVLAMMLLTLSGILFFHDIITRNVALYRATRLTFLAVTLCFLGLYAGTQLSIVNVITFSHALLTGFRWEFFLVEPLTFMLWSFVALALLFWGRGVFCGWLCPFGALQELLNEGARKLGVRQFEVPWTLHERLWPIKYVAFLVILGVSFQSTADAFRLAEIEPFKTAISLRFIREWPFVLYVLALLGGGLFIERFYCRYLCPLGAALAIPAKLRLFEWLKRRPQCGRECRICAARCTVQAINPVGQIVPNECIYCLQCQANYYDPTTCLPLKQRAARRGAKRAVGADHDV